MKLYPWQKQLLKIYKGKGIVKGTPGSGKTIGALSLIYNRKYKDVLIAVPTLTLKKQWKDELKRFKMNARVETFHKLYKPNDISCDLFIVDECHRSTSPMFIKMYKYVIYKDILGLSATPNMLSKKRCGDIILTVSMDEANIADFKVVFVSVPLLPKEKIEYKTISNKLRSSMAEEEHIHPQQKQIIDALVYKRRSLVYNAKERIPIACKYIYENRNKNTLVICQRIEQANRLSTITGHPVYHSKKQDNKVLEDFKKGKHRCLISVGMLKEGFDKRDIDCLIIVSTAITEAHHIQTIGRAIRLPNDAIIYILLAFDTTDEKILKFRSRYKYEIEGKFTGKYDTPPSKLTKLYYKSKKYGLDHKYNLFKSTKKGRFYYKKNPIINDLKQYLLRGGSFRISKDKKVMVLFKNKVVVVTTLKEPLVESKEINVMRDLW